MGKTRAPSLRWLARFGTAAMMGIALAATPVSPATAAVDDGTIQYSAIIKDSVNYWNDVILETFRRKGGGPGPLARIAAIVNAGIFDAANSVVYSLSDQAVYDPYLTLTYRAEPVDADLAIGYTAKALLIYAEPAQQTFFEQKFTERYGTRGQKEASILSGQVVNPIKTARTGDGSADTTPYQLDNMAGAWRPTQACTAIDPNWGKVKPFTMTSSTQFRQPLPGSSYSAVLSSPTYRTYLDQVRSLGRYNSTSRTADQTQAAFFWANDLDGTYKPPGQYLDTARDVANARLTDGLDIARVLALVSLAMADAGIAAWDMKYQTPVDLWRPQTAIQLDSVNPDPSWLPLSADYSGNRFSPCFPAWVSGHATFGAAWAGIMRNIFGDNVTFTVSTEDPHAVGVTRTFNSFTAAATENGLSRIWLGVHYKFDDDNGQAAGYAIADYAHANYLDPANLD